MDQSGFDIIASNFLLIRRLGYLLYQAYHEVYVYYFRDITLLCLLKENSISEIILPLYKGCESLTRYDIFKRKFSGNCKLRKR